MSNSNDDPRTIEAEIRNTQSAMSRTADELTNKLNPKALLQSFTGDGNGSEALATVKQKAADNPLALALIGAGVAWLFAGPDAKPSTFTSDDDDFQKMNTDRNKISSKSSSDPYVAHMATVERRDGETEPDYQRRRDDARGTYFRMERHHGENDQNFRDRLNDASDKMSEKRQELANRASNLSSKAGEKRRDASQRAQLLYNDNPIMGGLIAMLAGAAAGAAAPVTSRETELLGEYGSKARSKLGEQVNKAADMAERQVHPDRESPISVDQG